MVNQDIVSYNNSLNRYQDDVRRQQSSQTADSSGGNYSAGYAGGGGDSSLQAQAILPCCLMH